jgi:hypothetical protein
MKKDMQNVCGKGGCFMSEHDTFLLGFKEMLFIHFVGLIVVQIPVLLSMLGIPKHKPVSVNVYLLWLCFSILALLISLGLLSGTTIPLRTAISKDGVKWRMAFCPTKSVAWDKIWRVEYMRRSNQILVLIRYNGWSRYVSKCVIFHGDRNLVADFQKYGRAVPSELIVSTWLLKTKKIASWLGEPPEEFYKIMGIEKESVKKDDDR